MRTRAWIVGGVAAMGVAAALFGATGQGPPRGGGVSTTATKPAERPPADPAEYAARRSKLKPDDVEGDLALARWARDRAMWTEAVDMAGAANFADPGNRAAYLILQQVDEARPLPDEPEVEDALKAEFLKRFSHEFKTRVGKHFIFCYDTTDTFAAQRATNMEKVYDAFQFYFTMSTLRPAFLEHRLVVILFKDRDDYLGYIKQTERVDLSWSAGFYSQRSNRSAFFDDSSGATATSYNKEAEDLKAKIEDLNKQVAVANAQNDRVLVNKLNQEKSSAGNQLTQMTNRIGTTIAMLNNTKTLHEAAHQVSFNIGIQTRMVDYPMWFSEGLACSFETEDANGRRGPAVLNRGRVGVIKGAIKANNLLTIEDLIKQSIPAKTDNDTMQMVYSEGWGLFNYLYKYERGGMEKYLMAYNVHAPVTAISDNERLKIFTDAFGPDMDTLNRKFVTYLKSLPAN